MTQTINEAMERRAADLETVKNRTATLKEHYESIAAKAAELDSSMKIEPFGTFRDSGNDELRARCKFLDDMSERYVRLVNAYEQLKVQR